MHEACMVGGGRSQCPLCKKKGQSSSDVWAKFRSLGFLLRAPDPLKDYERGKVEGIRKHLTKSQQKRCHRHGGWWKRQTRSSWGRKIYSMPLWLRALQAGRSGFDSWPCCWTVLWSWMSQFTSLSLSFLVYEVGAIIICIIQGKTQRRTHRKCSRGQAAWRKVKGERVGQL